MLDKNFIQYVRTSCGDAVSQDKEYMGLQAKLVQAEKDGDLNSLDEYNSRMEVRAEEVCFIAGWNAAMQLIIKGGGAFNGEYDNGAGYCLKRYHSGASLNY